MSSDKRTFGCVEYTVIIAICALLGFILYMSFQHSPHEIHKSKTSPPYQIIQGSKVSNQASSNPSIGNKMGHVRGATMGSAMLSTAKPIQQSIRYIPIHLQKATRTIRIIPEGQEGD